MERLQECQQLRHTVLADSLLMALACKLILNYRDVQRDIGHKWFRTPFLEMGCL